MSKVKLYLDYAGYCTAKESHAIRGGKNKLIKFHALFGLISHPVHGWILFDTGYTRRFYEATSHFPNSLYAAITKVSVTGEDEVKSKLKYYGIRSTDIKHIIITHFHADHIGGLKDFEQATFYCSKPAYYQMHHIPNAMAFTKGILKSLIPADFDHRVKFIEDHCPAISDGILGIKYDLFKDGSVLLTLLEGHAAGQLGALISTSKNEYFLVADACWLRRSFEEMILPSPIVKLFFNSWKEFRISLQKVHSYYKAWPNTIIVPTHCAETTEKLISSKYLLNEL